MTRREAMTLISTGLIAGGAAGCDPVRSDRVMIRFWNGWTGPDGSRALTIVRAFNRANPDIEVRMQRIEWGTYYNKLFVAGIAGRAPELFVLHTAALRRFAEANFLQSIDPLVVKGFPVSDLDTNVWNAASIDGRYVGLPVDIHLLGLFYNRTLLKSAGFDQPPTDRDSFLEAARRITRGDGADRIWGFAFSNGSPTVFSLMRQFGGTLFTDDFSRCTMANAENAAALQFCRDLIAKEKTTPEPAAIDPWIAFRQGRVGMTMNGIYMLPDLQKQADLDFAGSPIPKIGSTSAAWAGSHNFCLKARMDDRTTEAAWRFCQYYSDHSLEWAMAGQVPARRSLRETEAFRQMSVQSQFARQIPYAAYQPQLPFLFEFQTEFDFMVERVLRGSVAPEAALADAEANVNKIIRRRVEEGASIR